MNDFKYALSYSRISDYRQCPLKFKFKYVDKSAKFKEDEGKSPHLIRGGNVHKALETYILQKKIGEEVRISSLPEVESTKPFVDKLFTMYSEIVPESQIAVNNNWQQVEWFAKDAYMRAIFDVIALNSNQVFIGDFKTGKMHDYAGSMEHPGQLHLSAAIALKLFPKIPTVQTAYLYVDHKKIINLEFDRDQGDEISAKFDDEHKQINSDTEFKPKINDFCKWCPATKTMCPFSRKL
jgi:CRISPR/Cas system-associated exonuclease Cas4 (RecB family)